MAKQQCSVFISSTSEDLQEYRLAAREAALRAGFLPVMMEYFAASGGPPLRECLAKVEPCDVVVVIAAQRYGWVPSDQPLSGAKSITWLECERAKDLLVFFPDQDVTWPVERTEAYRLTAAFNESKFTPELVAEVTRNTAKLAEFREWLNRRTRASFKTPADLETKVLHALYEWLKRHPECQPLQKGPSNPRPYLEWLREQTATIDIRGLGVGSGKAHKFPIEDLYIPLTTQREAEAPTERERKPMELEEALVHRRLVIVGDPGLRQDHLPAAHRERPGQWNGWKRSRHSPNRTRPQLLGPPAVVVPAHRSRSLPTVPAIHSHRRPDRAHRALPRSARSPQPGAGIGAMAKFRSANKRGRPGMAIPIHNRSRDKARSVHGQSKARPTGKRGRRNQRLLHKRNGILTPRGRREETNGKGNSALLEHAMP